MGVVVGEGVEEIVWADLANLTQPVLRHEESDIFWGNSTLY